MTAEQLTRQYQDKRLRIEFSDGQTAEVLVLVVSECGKHEDCRGIVYDLVSDGRPGERHPGTSYWTELKYIRNFEVIGATN
jgi:hypothetical protein